MSRKARSGPRVSGFTEAKIAALVEEAVVDCHDESEQLTGIYTMIEDNLAMPFDTQVLGVDVTVARIDLTESDEIVAHCTRGRSRQAIPLLELPLPTPPPEGVEWIDAYRRWTRGR